MFLSQSLPEDRSLLIFDFRPAAFLMFTWDEEGAWKNSVTKQISIDAAFFEWIENEKKWGDLRDEHEEEREIINVHFV